MQDEIDTQTELLRELNIAFEVWDQERLSRMLKDLPELVVEFFDYPWLEAFAPHHARHVSPRRMVAALAAEFGRDHAPR